MTTSTSNDMQELIGNARKGQQWFGYRLDCRFPRGSEPGKQIISTEI